MNDACGSVAARTRPGELLRLVADGLAGSGLDVCLSEHAEASRLVIVCGTGQCVVSVSDWGCADIAAAQEDGQRKRM